MKKIVTIISVFILLITCTRSNAQTFAAALPAMHSELLQPPAVVNLAAPGAGDKRAKSVMLSGFGLMGAGSLMFVGGIALALSADNENNTTNNGHIGVAILVGGVMVFVAGTAMSIVGGSVYHHSKKHRYSIISPKKNQLGLAYDF